MTTNIRKLLITIFLLCLAISAISPPASAVIKACIDGTGFDYTGLFFQNGTRSMTGVFDAGGYSIMDLMTGSYASNATNKSYVDAVNTSMKNYVDSLPPSVTDVSWNVTYMLKTIGESMIATNLSASKSYTDQQIEANISLVWNNKTWETVANVSTYVNAVNTSMRNNVSMNFPSIAYVDAVNTSMRNNVSMNFPSTAYVDAVNTSMRNNVSMNFPSTAYVDAVNTSMRNNVSMNFPSIAYVDAVNTSMRNNVSMNYAPLVAGKVPTTNLGGAGADATKYLRGDQTWQTVSASAPTSATAVVMSSDFYEPSTNAVPGLLGAAIGSGTNVIFGTTTAPHPGVITINDSTTGGGGYRYGCTASGNWLLAGGESFEFVFQTNGIRPGQNTRVGWADTATGTALPVDGVWLNLTNVAGAANWTGNTASNSNRGQTSTKFAGSAGTWYRGTISINAAGTLVTYTIYNEAGVSQWTDTLATNIPTGAGRDTSPCIIATEGTTDAAAALLKADYAKWEVTRALVR